jgi:hypothetical protein
MRVSNNFSSTFIYLFIWTKLNLFIDEIRMIPKRESKYTSIPKYIMQNKRRDISSHTESTFIK